MRPIHLLEPLTDIVTECELSVPLEPLHQKNSSFNYRNPAPTMVMPAQTRNPDQATEANVPKIMTSKGHMDFLLALSAPQLHRCILEPVDSTLDRSANVELMATHTADTAVLSEAAPHATLFFWTPLVPKILLGSEMQVCPQVNNMRLFRCGTASPNR
jgi:hypothetical protein